MFDYNGIPVERKIAYLQDEGFWENPATDLNPAELLEYCDVMLDANAVLRRDLDAWLVDNPGEAPDLTPFNGLDNRSYEQLMADVQDRNILAESIQQVDMGAEVRVADLPREESIGETSPMRVKGYQVGNIDHHVTHTVEVFTTPRALTKDVVEEVMSLLDEPLASNTEIRICAKGFELGPKVALEILGTCHARTNRDMVLHTDSQGKRVVIATLVDGAKLQRTITIEMRLYTL